MSVITMGCRVNQFETELLRHGGFERGFVSASKNQQPELIIVNTCSVTAESDRQARQLIRRAARKNPQAHIVVTGCYAQRTPERLAELPQVRLVLGNQEKSELWHHVDRMLLETLSGVAQRDSTICVGNIAELSQVPDRPIVDHFAERARAFVQLQDGCDRSCTYCLIPAVRGPSRSLTPEQILAQARQFIQAGYQELVLTGIDLGSYGSDLTPNLPLADMIEQIASLEGLGRVRLSSIDPADIDDALIQLFEKEKKICPYLHLSIQSGDDMILKRMGRRGTHDQIVAQIGRLKKARPETLLGADFIVGFPTESQPAFLQSLTLVNETRLAFLHTFRYSDRPGTPAAQIPQRFRVADGEAKTRSEILRQAGEKNHLEAMEKELGKSGQVLIESINEEGRGRGKLDSFLSITFDCTAGEKVGEIRKVVVEGLDRVNSELVGILP